LDFKEEQRITRHLEIMRGFTRHSAHDNASLSWCFADNLPACLTALLACRRHGKPAGRNIILG